jgi:hypothetical protein
LSTLISLPKNNFQNTKEKSQGIYVLLHTSSFPSRFEA